MNNKKLLVLTSTFPRWKNDPNPTFVHELSKRLTNCFNVFVLSPYSKGSKIYEESFDMRIHRFRYWLDRDSILTNGAILPNLKKNKGLYLQIPFFVLSELLSLIKICRQEKIDVIQAHWIIPQGLIAVLYKKLFNKKVKIIITSHGADAFALQRLGFLKRWIINQANSLTVVSHEIKSKLQELNINPGIPINVIPMGVDCNLFNSNKYNHQIKNQYNISGPLLLFVGRLTDKKGIYYLIEAMPDIIRHQPKAKLLIIGHGEEQERIQNIIKQKQLADNILLLGGISNQELPQFYATADIFIAPFIISNDGDREGMPVTILEALASNCRILTTELIKSNLKDLPAQSELAKKIRIIEQKSARAITEAVIDMLQQAPQQWAVDVIRTIKLDWDSVAQNYQSVLEKLHVNSSVPSTTAPISSTPATPPDPPNLEWEALARSDDAID